MIFSVRPGFLTHEHTPFLFSSLSMLVCAYLNHLCKVSHEVPLSGYITSSVSIFTQMEMEVVSSHRGLQQPCCDLGVPWIKFFHGVHLAKWNCWPQSTYSHVCIFHLPSAYTTHLQEPCLLVNTWRPRTALFGQSDWCRRSSQYCLEARVPDCKWV